MSSMPRYDNESMCVGDSNPDAWFYDEDEPESSYTGEALRARGLCSMCPARDECMEYSLQFSNLSGIWAGLDRNERRLMRRRRRVAENKLVSSYEFLDVRPLSTQDAEDNAWI